MAELLTVKTQPDYTEIKSRRFRIHKNIKEICHNNTQIKNMLA